MEKFLDSLSKGTMKSYRRGLELFIEFYGKDTDTILAERKDDLTPRQNENLVDAKNRASRYENLLEEFHAWLMKPIHIINKKSNQAYGINTARTSTLGLLQLFRYYNMSMTLRNGSPISQTVISTGDFVLMPEHVRAMFHSARAILGFFNKYLIPNIIHCINNCTSPQEKCDIYIPHWKAIC